MSNNTRQHLSIEKADNFFLLDGKNNKIFGIYKTIRSNELINQYKKDNSLMSTISKNDYTISHEIDLKFIILVNENDNFNKEKILLNKNNFNNSNTSSFDNKIFTDDILVKMFNNKNELHEKKIKYCKNIIKKRYNSKNVLIRPIMYEDTLSNNKTNNQNLNFSQKKIFDINKINLNYKKFLNYSQKINNFNKNFYQNNSISANEIQNIIQNISNKEEKFETLENKLKEPIFWKDEYDYLNKNDKIIYNENQKIKLLDYSNNELFKRSSSDPFIIEKKNLNLSLGYSTGLESSNNINYNTNIIKENNNNLNSIIKSKGRKAKNSKNTSIESKHTKHSPDNMMRKIKNKVIESSRLLINKVLNDEIKNQNVKFGVIHKEFRKIQGSFGQELNIKYNFWFYQIKIKDIFCLEISNKYTTIEKSSNKELIDYLFSPLNNNKFIKTKQLLNLPFHQYYHDIFLNEDQNWKKYYKISDNDDKYQIDFLLKYLEDDEENVEENKKYINDIKELAHHYEEFFLEKKPRNVDYNNKKNDSIKVFMSNMVNDKYLQLHEEVKQLKNYYENRNLKKEESNKIVLINQKNNEIMDNLLNKKNVINGSDNNLSYQNENNELKIKIKNSITTLNISESPNEEKIPEYENLINNVNIISLEEKNQKENDDENICNNINNKKENNLKNEELEKYINKEYYFCNKKRNDNNLKYFISCKKFKNLDLYNDFSVDKKEK